MLLTRAGGANCPVVDSFMEAIARDVGLPLSALSEPGAFDSMVRRVLRAPIGPKVEMRRWFTFMDAGPDLDRAWHTMLVALIVEFWLEGADPWEVAAKAAARRTDARGDPSENFSYRTEALAILMDGRNQNVLRSILVVHDLSRRHQAAYIRDSGEETCGLRYLQFWASPMAARRLVGRTVHSALCQPGNLRYCGLGGESCDPLPVAIADEVPASADEYQFIMWMHWRCAMQAAGEIWLFLYQPQSPPWSCCLLLVDDAAGQGRALAHLKRVWETILALEASSLRERVAFAELLHFRHWVVFREVMNLLELSNFEEVSPAATRYVQAMFPGYLDSLGLELMFNDMRDNELRQARHGQRGDLSHAAMSISSAATRYPEAKHIVPSPEIMAQTRSVHVSPSLFRTALAPRTAEALGVDSALLEQSGGAYWPSPPIESMNKTAWPLLRSLLRTPAEDWCHLWVASLLRAHMVVKCEDSGLCFYVFLATKWSICVWALQPVPDRGANCLAFAGCFDDAAEMSVVSLARFTCYDYSMQLSRSDPAPMWLFILSRGRTLRHYMVREHLHAATRETLHNVMGALGVTARGLATNVQKLEAILAKLTSVPEAEKDACMARAVALAEKRKRKDKRSGGEATDDEAASEGSAEYEGDSRVDPRDLHIPPVLLAAAPKEVAFVCGRAGASQAIKEEEDDDGLEEARKLLRKRGATSKRARTDADEPPPPRGHQDSPRTQQ